ncbi:MAG: hypothetical protein ACR2IP_01565 [Solirubrobacteraceae bacterium]
MSRERRGLIADVLVLLAALLLGASLFLTWSHQLPDPVLRVAGASQALAGVPRDPTAWQVYSAADVVLALLAAGLFTAALIGTPVARMGLFAAALVGLAFVIHAAGVPPTSGVADVLPVLHVPPSVAAAGSGAGISVAIVALGLALSGLALSFTAD